MSREDFYEARSIEVRLYVDLKASGRLKWKRLYIGCCLEKCKVEEKREINEEERSRKAWHLC